MASGDSARTRFAWIVLGGDQTFHAGHLTSLFSDMPSLLLGHMIMLRVLDFLVRDFHKIPRLPIFYFHSLLHSRTICKPGIYISQLPVHSSPISDCNLAICQYSPSSCINFPWLPLSTICPCLNTKISSASTIVFSRWAIAMTVRPFITR